MSKNFDIQEMTIKQICNCIAVVNRMVNEKIIIFNPNKASVVFNYDKASRFLEKQNIDLQQRIDKAIEYIENTRVDNNYMVQEKYEHLLEILDFHQ